MWTNSQLPRRTFAEIRNGKLQFFCSVFSLLDEIQSTKKDEHTRIER